MSRVRFDRKKKCFRTSGQILRGLGPFIAKHLVQLISAADAKAAANLPCMPLPVPICIAGNATASDGQRYSADPYKYGLMVHRSVQRAVNRKIKKAAKISAPAQMILRALGRCRMIPKRCEVGVMWKAAGIGTQVDMVAEKNGRPVIVELKTTRAAQYHAYIYQLHANFGIPMRLTQAHVDQIQALGTLSLFQKTGDPVTPPLVEDVVLVHSPSAEVARVYQLQDEIASLRPRMEQIMLAVRAK